MLHLTPQKQMKTSAGSCTMCDFHNFGPIFAGQWSVSFRRQMERQIHRQMPCAEFYTYVLLNRCQIKLEARFFAKKRSRHFFILVIWPNVINMTSNHFMPHHFVFYMIF